MSLNDSLLPEDRADAAEGFHEARERSGRSDKGLAGSAVYFGSPQLAYLGSPPIAYLRSGTFSTPTVQPENVTPTNVQSEDGTPGRQQQPPCQAWFPLNDKAASLFFSKVTDTAVMGLVTLATFFSTYLLAWGKPGTNCIPYFNASDPNAKYPDPSWHQIIIGLLPFVVFPITLYLSGLGKVAEIEKRALSVVSTICLSEIILAFVLGGMMSHCMAAAPLRASFVVTASLVLVAIVMWGLTFKYPKILRFFIWSMCLRRAEVEQEDV